MYSIKGKFTPPGDKSISHRALILSSIAKGESHIKGLSDSIDCQSTANCLKSLGIMIKHRADESLVYGRGLYGLDANKGILDCGNSATTMRLLSAVLSAQDFSSLLGGDASLQKRPMGRIILPLSMMGADIRAKDKSGYPPLSIYGRKLSAINYISPIASAQLKSALLLAGLYAEGETCIEEPAPSRNHTEIMLSQMGADITVRDRKIRIRPTEALCPLDLHIPGDISSAAYFIAAAILLPHSELLIRNTGINPTRTGMMDILKKMGASIEIINTSEKNGEEYGDILVRSSEITGTVIEGDLIPSMIDELPLIAAMAALAEGKTLIRDAQELKVKESDRIKVMVEGLRKMGADICETGDGMIIQGKKKLSAAHIDTYFDHRIAMTFSLLSLLVDGDMHIKGKEAVRISYPSFYNDLRALIR